MHVACLDCNTRYDIPAEVLSPEGQSVKCCRCGLIFGVKPRGEIELPLEEVIQKKRSIGIGTILLLLILAGMVGYLFAVKPQYLDILSPQGIAKVKAHFAGPPTLDITKAPNGSYIKRQDGKTVFVMTGYISNSSSSAASAPKVTAILFDSKMVKLDSQTGYSGILITPDEIEKLPIKEITGKLQSPPANTMVEPGGELPFVIVFPSPPTGVLEYEVKVVPMGGAG